METIKDRVLNLLYELVRLAGIHCANLVTALNENAKLLNAQPLLIIVGDPDAIANLAAAEFPTCFGSKGCYRLDASSIYHLIPGEQIVEERESSANHFKFVKIKTPDLVDRVVLISDLSHLAQLMAVVRFSDRIIVTKSNELTDDDLEKLSCLDSTDVGVTYIGPNHQKVKDTLFANREDVAYFHQAVNNDLKSHLSGCCANAQERHFHRVVHTSLQMAESMGDRLDETEALVEEASSRELDVTYAEKDAAMNRLLPKMERRKKHLRDAIGSVYREEQLQLGLKFQKGTKDSVHRKAIDVVAALQSPREFDETTNESVNETIYIETNRAVATSTETVIRGSATVYAKETDCLRAEIREAGFTITPVCPPLEVESISAKNAIYKNIAPLLLDVDPSELKLSNYQSLYRYQALPISFTTGFAILILRILSDEDKDEKVAALLDLEGGAVEGIAEVAAEVVEGVVEGVVEEVLGQATGQMVGVAGSSTLGTVIGGGAGASAGAGAAGVGGTTVTALYSATGPLTVASGGTALPLIVLVGGCALLGSFIGKKIEQHTQMKEFRNGYEKAIGSSMSAISTVANAALINTRDLIANEAISAFDTLGLAIREALMAEVETHREVEEAPALLVYIENDRGKLQTVISELSEMARESFVTVAEEDPLE